MAEPQVRSPAKRALWRAIRSGTIALALVLVVAAVWGWITGGGISHAAPGPGWRGAVFGMFVGAVFLGIPALLVGATVGLIAGWRRQADRKTANRPEPE